VIVVNLVEFLVSRKQSAFDGPVFQIGLGQLGQLKIRLCRIDPFLEVQIAGINRVTDSQFGSWFGWEGDCCNLFDGPVSNQVSQKETFSCKMGSARLRAKRS